MRRHLLLIIILLLAALLRLIALGKIPAGISPDEVSQGYSAYSLLKTGKDEWGISWPVTSFRAFADYRAPLQTYLILPSVALFGLNEFAVRLPSAVFGILAVLAAYLLTKELFKSEKTALLAAFFLAISPWHIQFSRTALEANFASFLFPLGIFFLLRGIKGNRKLLILSAIVLGLDLYSYLAAKLFVPLFILAIFLFNHAQIFKQGIKRLAPFLLIFSAFAIPIYFDAFFGPGNVRGKDLSITNFSVSNLTTISNEQYYSPLNAISPQLPRLFSNKVVFTIGQFVSNYISYLSPTFWFTEGGREITYSVFPGMGLLHLWMFPLIIIAFYRLIINKDKNFVLILSWLLLAIVPAAITKEGYRPNRVGSLLTFWEIIAAYGTLELFSKFKNQIVRLGFVAIILVSLVAYVNFYVFIAPTKYPSALSFGYRDLISKIDKYKDKYKNIIVDRGNQSQIFVAFYDHLDPTLYQTYSSQWWPQIQKRKLLFLDMLDPYTLGQYTFKTFNVSVDLAPGNLVVIPAPKMRDDWKSLMIDQVNYPDQTPAFYLLANNEK